MVPDVKTMISVPLVSLVHNTASLSLPLHRSTGSETSATAPPGISATTRIPGIARLKTFKPAELVTYNCGRATEI